MSQHDLVVDNGPGINVRLDLNQAIQALGSMELGTAAPAPTYPCQLWADQTTGLKKKRNTANTAWLVDGKLDTATGGGVPVGGAAGSILAKNSGADGDMVWTTASFLGAGGGTISGNLSVSGTLTVAGVSTLNNTLQVNGAALSTVNFQCNVPGGQNALYWSNVAGVRQWYSGCISTGAFWIADQSAGANRFAIATDGTITVPGRLNGTLQDGIAIIVPAGNYARFISSVAGARVWAMGGHPDGLFCIDDNTAGANRLQINSAGLVTVQSLSVIGAFTVASFNTATITATNSIHCNPASGAAWYYATCAGVRAWQWGANTDGGFFVYDSSGAATRFKIDVTGDATFLQDLTVNGNFVASGTGTIGSTLVASGGINCGSTGIAYTGLDPDRIAFRYISLSNFGLFINGVSVGTIYTLASDERMKKNIGKAEGDALDELRRIDLVSYDMLDKGKTHVGVGFSAQQIESIIPEAVVSNPRHMEDDGETVLSVNSAALLARCIGAIQQLAARIETLEGR